MHETSISNSPPSLTSPTVPNGTALIGGSVQRVTITLTLRGTPWDQPDLDEIFRELDVERPTPPAFLRLGKRAPRIVDEARSNGSSYGFPSYTAQRFAPPSLPRKALSAPRPPPMPARSRHARDATKRRKRSRDFARTGRRRPWQSR